MEISPKAMEILQMSRCADISDALDSLGLQGQYHMDPAMRPLIPTTRFTGIARTIEFEPAEVKMPYLSYEDFERLQYATKWEGGFNYFENSGRNIRMQDSWDYLASFGKGDVVVSACHGLVGGIWGSENGMGLLNSGIVGIVLDGYMRDTPECILENIPVFSKGISFVHPQGRLQVSSLGQPVVCANVLVYPGDVVCADYDGIIVVPQKQADETAYRSYRIQQIDRVNRRAKYIKAGMSLDASVELLPDLARWF